jgi:hypothetical protein
LRDGAWAEDELAEDVDDEKSYAWRSIHPKAIGVL